MGLQRRGMKPSLRRAAIHELIEKQGQTTVEDLTERFSASAETVRRDLNVLAEAGRIRKVHGGAVKAAATAEDPFEERQARNAHAKREVAEKLLTIIHPGQCVMIDTGSTTLACAEALARVRDLTVITNSTHIADKIVCGKKGGKAILLGGNYRSNNAQTVGPQTCAEAARFRPDHVVLTVSAIDASGAYDMSEEEAQVARAMVGTAGSLTIVADHSKINRTSTFKICDLSQVVHLILNRPPDAPLSAALKAAGTIVH